MIIETLAAVALMSGGQEVSPRVAPRGDYRESCSGEYVNRGRLYADCRTNRGQIRGTSIELNRCSDYTIRNNDGLLVCGPVRGQFEGRPGNGGGNGPGPGNGGGWGGRASITVFRDANYRGATYTFNEEIPNLANSGMNDAISSMQVRGDWEVCTDANFRGNCQIVRQDVRNLQNWGLNDRISSLRPVRRGGR
jgi:Beta/Gamma crystallin